MNKKLSWSSILFLSLCLFAFSSCDSDDDDKDLEKPQIDMSFDSAFPQNCTILHRGESFTFKAIFKDNEELGSYNLEIHNNFDHHSHSTEITECDPEPNKKPVNPLVFNKDYTIPDGKTVYEASAEITIPDNIDTGDYHFSIRVTDKAGWQEIKAFSVKIKDKE